MPYIEVSGKQIEIDEEGYLRNFDDWTEGVACAIAEREGVEELTRERLDIIRFIRDYYRRYNFFPILNAICKNVNQPRDCINEQFLDPVLAWKIAGLPRPDETMINLLRYGQTPT
jgi:TusE/DsrC/DsvC family sulfur relay protein